MLEKRWSTSTSLREHYDKFHIREQGLGLLAWTTIKTAQLSFYSPRATGAGIQAM
jgi:hypothetical protein